MKLYSYWRSTTSLRVRAALNLKGLSYDYAPVNLVTGEQGGAYAGINPSKGVPALELDDGTVLTQSLAILNYLDEVHPEPALLPADPLARAQVRAAADCIALDIHPVNNLKVLGYLKGPFERSQDDAVVWMRHWMHEGFSAFQTLIRDDTPFSFGPRPGLADLCLVGQMVNARRWGLDLTGFDRLVEIDAACQKIDAIARAMPEHQPDAD